MSELLCCLASGGSIKKNDRVKWWLIMTSCHPRLSNSMTVRTKTFNWFLLRLFLGAKYRLQNLFLIIIVKSQQCIFHRGDYLNEWEYSKFKNIFQEKMYKNIRITRMVYLTIAKDSFEICKCLFRMCLYLKFSDSTYLVEPHSMSSILMQNISLTLNKDLTTAPIILCLLFTFCI